MEETAGELWANITGQTASKVSFRIFQKHLPMLAALH